MPLQEVHEYQKAGVIKQVKQRGTFHFVEAVRALGIYWRERARRKGSQNTDLDREKLLQLSAKREMDEIKLQTIRGDVHRTEDIEKVFGAMVTRIRSNLLSLPMGVAPAVAGKENINQIAEIIKDRLDRALYEVSNFDFNNFAEQDTENYIKSLEDDNEGGDNEANASEV